MDIKSKNVNIFLFFFYDLPIVIDFFLLKLHRESPKKVINCLT